ncbi:MAG TPA: ATP phosphoribosyltransferase regulatory subunit, partial [Verrucomicrobiae bacterium]|nr:ATP phosphoribosyltransferase regulatory subunit [Verrucomicrobiae bacterium]
LELFTAKSGEEIVGQLYNFTDKGGREIALRPEMTPTLARMVAAHERNYKKPIKWFTIPQLFRYERQQKGRLREHFQLNADIIGEADPAADAELIALLIDTLRAFGLGPEDFVIRLSSRNAWQSFFSQHNGDNARQYDFFQTIDKLEREDPDVSASKLKALGISMELVRAFIEAGAPTPELKVVLENLSARDLQAFVKIDYGVIRGLAYYTGVVFEAFDRKGEFRAIAGGGRYDNLIGLLSGGRVSLPALGFGMGDVVLAELLKARKHLHQCQTVIEVFCLIEDETLRPESLRFIQNLRQEGATVEYSLTPAKPDKQFKRAQELGARFIARLERTASGSIAVSVRDLKSRQQQSGDPGEMLRYLASNRT